MKKEDLRPIEIIKPIQETDKYGWPIPSILGGKVKDTYHYDGLFHMWHEGPELKAIVEVEGRIEIIPYQWVKFLD